MSLVHFLFTVNAISIRARQLFWLNIIRGILLLCFRFKCSSMLSQPVPRKSERKRKAPQYFIPTDATADNKERRKARKVEVEIPPQIVTLRYCFRFAYPAEALGTWRLGGLEVWRRQGLERLRSKRL